MGTEPADGGHEEGVVSSSTETTSANGVSCHDHAGVPHCVDAHGNTVESECTRPQRDYNVRLRIGLLFVILVTSALGVFAPILTSRFTSWKQDHLVIVAMRQFGTGIIISTAIVHLFTHAELYFGSECLGGLDYEATTGAILMAGLFLTFIIEYIAHRVSNRNISITTEPGTSDPKPTDVASEDSLRPKNTAPQNLTLATTIMEAGIIFHSLLIGLVLVVAGDSGLITLFIVILFHQVFEGFSLGSRIAMIPGGFGHKIVLGVVFALTTPLGMAIGIGVLSKFNGNDPSTLIAIGTLNAFSAGILLWVGVVEMWFQEWFMGPLADAGAVKTIVCMLSLVSGIVVMSVLGKWA
ncbi:high-affinity Zn(2+) transporter zrt1 [Elasticomyces elasticus]|nr:high-affinity Zn(2+) transporter zrt1 [Elasticomyces elasticus]KAK3667730.1 high-affinity Zn(2+) transporter zrt1 [Elasticomyces elasticus]